MNVRTRFAPSPTGRLHLGNVRTAVFNWLLARRHGGQFVLRIEDTDVERNVAGAEAALMEDLRWLGLDWDEGPDMGGPVGPYRQSERGEIHRAHAEQLRLTGAAYPCFCGEDAAGADRRYPGTCRELDPEEVGRRLGAGETHVLRLKTARHGEVEIKDEVRGAISFPASDVDDFVILRSDGRPTYNFGVVVDDMLMRISHVIRGAGHLSNTPKQVLIFRAFDAAPPSFAHLPTVLSPEGGKLSKRSGAAAVAELREEGMLPIAVVNYLSLLGWSHPDEREILDLDELVEAIDLHRVGPSDTQFDPEKMRWVAQQHFQGLSDAEYLTGISDLLESEGIEREGIAWAAEAIRSRLATYEEAHEHLGHFFPDPERLAASRAEILRSDQGRALAAAVARHVAALEEWNPPALKDAFRRAGAEIGVGGRDLFVPIRVLLTGQEHGPDLTLISAALGRVIVLKRLGGSEQGS